MKQDDFAKSLARSIMCDGMSPQWRFGTLCAQNIEVQKLILKELRCVTAEQLVAKLSEDSNAD